MQSNIRCRCSKCKILKPDSPGAWRPPFYCPECRKTWNGRIRVWKAETKLFVLRCRRIFASFLTRIAIRVCWNGVYRETQPRWSGFRVKRLLASSEIIASLFTEGEHHYQVIENPLPADATILFCRSIDKRSIEMFVESSEFPVVGDDGKVSEIEPRFVTRGRFYEQLQAATSGFRTGN